MLKIALIIVGLMALAVILPALAGSFYPKGHVAGRSVILKASVEEVWKTVSNFESQTEWRTNLKSVARLPGEPEVWRESDGKESIDLKTSRLERPKWIVREVVGENLPFSGLWEFALAETAGGGTRLTLTERGEVPNPIFRFIAAHFMDPAGKIEVYLNDLAKKLGEPEAKPIPIP